MGCSIRIAWFVAGWIALAAMPETGTVVAQPPDSSLAAQGAEALIRGNRALLDVQAADGLWHSETYGNLKEGAGVSALILEALARNRDRLPDDGLARLKRGAAVLALSVERCGYVSNADGADYSDYASALLLQADTLGGLGLSAEVRLQLRDYLVRSQLDEEEGFAPEHCEHGGWDMTGWMTGPRPTAGTNISVSCFVLEALGGLGDDAATTSAQQRAAAWLEGCRNEDGGFCFHPRADHEGNKAGWTDETRTVARSYGTCTADGLRALTALGVSPDDARVIAAREWLARAETASGVPGFQDDPESVSWSNGLQLYYYASLARILDQLPADLARELSGPVLQELVRTQQADGTWRNPNARMREDDPLIATAFAVVALQGILDHDSAAER